jgi:hypothetical protein
MKLALALLMALALSAPARLGETREELIKRYGEPLDPFRSPGFKGPDPFELMFHVGPLRVMVHLIDGVSHEEHVSRWEHGEIGPVAMRRDLLDRIVFGRDATDVPGPSGCWVLMNTNATPANPVTNAPPPDWRPFSPAPGAFKGEVNLVSIPVTLTNLNKYAPVGAHAVITTDVIQVSRSVFPHYYINLPGMPPHVEGIYDGRDAVRRF